MKSMIYQFYNEGFATTFCVKPIKYIQNKVKNKNIVEFLVASIYTIYTLLVIVLLLTYVYFKFFK